LLKLQKQLIDAQIENIQNENDRRIAEIENGFSEQVQKLNENYDKLIQETAEREKEYARLFGETSKELKALRQKNLEDTAKVAELTNETVLQLEQKKNADIAQAQKEFNDSEAQKQIEFLQKQREIREKALADTLQRIGNAEQLALLQREEQTAKTLSNITDLEQRAAIERVQQEQDLATRLNSIRQKLQAVAEAQDLQKLNIAVGIEVPQDEIDATILQAQQLKTELAKLELEQTEFVQQQAQARAEARNTEFQKIGGYASQTLDLIGGFEDAFSEREQKRLDERREQQEEGLAELEAQLEDATGLQKRFLLEQKREQEKQLKDLDKQKADLEKQSAKRKKATDIIQATINTALSVSAALATPPAPNLIAAGFAGALGAAQVALIAAQPLADGGIVGLNVRGRKIPQLPNGDNQLTTLRVGEVVLNERQQAALGGAATFAAIGVPGFASGGLVTPFISAAPNVSPILGSNSALAAAIERQAQALETRISNISVSLDTDKLREHQTTQNNISKNATIF
jgi:hypothetical protein